MKRTAHTQRGRRRRPAFRSEFLEPRHLLTGPSTLGFEGVNAPATIDLATTSPMAPAAVLQSSPTAIDLGFSAPFDPSLLGPFDAALESYDPTGGGWTSADAPPMLNPSLDGSSLQVVPGDALGSGLYRIVFPAGSSLNDGTTNQDEVVAEFQVAAPKGVGLGDAVDLGTVGPATQQATGVLDLQDNPEAVQLYKLELGPAISGGSAWRSTPSATAARCPPISRSSTPTAT